MKTFKITGKTSGGYYHKEKVTAMTERGAKEFYDRKWRTHEIVKCKKSK